MPQDQSLPGPLPSSGEPKGWPLMQLADFQSLRVQIAAVAQNDVHLGRVLDALFLHLAHLHGFDPAVEDAKARAVARQVARDEEDAQLKAAADALAAARALEDAQPRTPEQQAALVVSRAAEDAQIQADADALAKSRAEEDALEASEPAQAPVPAQEEAPTPVQEGEPVQVSEPVVAQEG